MNLDAVLSWESREVTQRYDARDTILYALGVGAASRGVDDFALRCVYESGLAALPAMCTVLAAPGFWARDNPQLGIDWVRLVHGDERFELHAPLPPEGEVSGRTRVIRVVDKGAAKGAIVTTQRVLTDKRTGQKLATVEQSIFCRGDGGCTSGQSTNATPLSDPAAPKTQRQDAPNIQRMDWPTAPDMAALYRWNGDLNPLHVDPAIASAAGFERPILHGLAFYGTACHVLMRMHGVAAERVRGMTARFTAPMLPGETLRVESWRDGDTIRFEARVAERDTQVLAGGSFLSD